MRPEIQALRAVAVVGVVIFHLWPEALPGGYVGVDIFFVISGFLITAHLVRELEATGRLRLGRFWARRARRLLPASLLVIALSAVATLLWAPQLHWQQFFREFAGSALYVENWLLAVDSVDYLAAENDSSPVQHYWSLSAEEQFYLVWPLLILLAFVVGRVAKRSSSRAVIVVVAAVTVASLAFSIWFTSTDPAQAYFITPTRMWEFGIGGLLAVVAAERTIQNRRLAIVASWSGLAAIVVTMVVFSDATPFPSYTALLPTLATALVIVAGMPVGASAPSWLMALRPMQWLGDVSYSLYLWHWPLIVFAPFVLLGDAQWWHPFVLLLLSLVLAELTKRFVEDPVRRSELLARWHNLPTLLATAASMALVVSVSVTVWNTVEADAQASIAEAEEIIREIEEQPESAAPNCFGPEAGLHGFTACVDPELEGVLVPRRGESDRAIDEKLRCRVNTEQSGVKRCILLKGDPDGVKIAVVGDSHAEHWVPAVLAVAEERGWRVDTYLKGGCPFSTVPRDDQSSNATTTCRDWNGRVVKRLKAGHYDLVLTSQISGKEAKAAKGESDVEAHARGFADRWTTIEETTGAVVVAFRDTPRMPFQMSKCLAKLGDEAASRASECSAPRDAALFPDGQELAAERLGVGIIDFTPHLCDATTCYGVVGSVVVFRDDDHLGGTFSRLLAPFLAEQLDAILAQRGVEFG